MVNTDGKLTRGVGPWFWTVPLLLLPLPVIVVSLWLGNAHGAGIPGLLPVPIVLGAVVAQLQPGVQAKGATDRVLLSALSAVLTVVAATGWALGLFIVLASLTCSGDCF